MPAADPLPQADSLIELLTAQCADLERLLALAREESRAIEDNDFDEVLRVIDARGNIGVRLEAYHRQVAELRERLGERADEVLNCDTAQHARRLVVEIQAQDNRLLPMLTTRREQIGGELARLDRTRHSTNAYLRGASVKATACDARA